jgi:hypothetical protein
MSPLCVPYQFNAVLAAFAKNEYLAQLINDRLGGNYLPFTKSLSDHIQVETHMSTLSAVGQLCRAEDCVDQMIESGLVGAIARVCTVHEKNVRSRHHPHARRSPFC